MNETAFKSNTTPPANSQNQLALALFGRCGQYPIYLIIASSLVSKQQPIQLYRALEGSSLRGDSLCRLIFTCVCMDGHVET